MADINAVKMSLNGVALFLTTQGEAEQTYAPSSHEDRGLIYVENTHPSEDISIVFDTGDGIRAAMDPTSPVGRLKVTVNAGDKMIVGPLESMRFVNNRGKNAGRIVITTSPETASYLRFAAVELP